MSKPLRLRAIASLASPAPRRKNLPSGVGILSNKLRSSDVRPELIISSFLYVFTAPWFHVDLVAEFNRIACCHDLDDQKLDETAEENQTVRNKDAETHSSAV